LLGDTVPNEDRISNLGKTVVHAVAMRVEDTTLLEISNHTLVLYSSIDTTIAIWSNSHLIANPPKKKKKKKEFVSTHVSLLRVSYFPSTSHSNPAIDALLSYLAL
jgi:hypothetical protein